MADFTSSYFYGLDFDGTNYSIADPVGTSSFNWTDADGGTTFAVGETVTDGGLSVEIAGKFGPGFFGYLAGANYYLFTNDPTLPLGMFTPDAGDLEVCFLTGTMIATPQGERAVETLAIGDLVMTAEGEIRSVRWMGVQTISRIFSDPQRGRPVTIRAGALGDNVPHRDLHVSPDHAMFVDGILAHAGALVNGTSIVRMADVPERFTYHHIELEDHALVLAEGAAAETFVDAVTRARFDNFAEYQALYGDETPDMIEEHVAPRALSARQLPPALRARLAARAEAMGFVEAIAA